MSAGRRSAPPAPIDDIDDKENPDMPRIRCLLVEATALLRVGLRVALTTDRDVVVVGEATTGRDACELAASLVPDVVILDTAPPELDGLAVAVGIHQRAPAASLILLTAPPDEDLRRFAHEVGAAAYRRLATSATELLAAVHRAAAPDQRSGASRSAQWRAAASALSESPHTPLSARELAVLTAIAQGGRNKEIACASGVCEQTVKNAVTTILRKLGVANRTGAVLHAVQHGWITLDTSL
jgi:DNA-binding NarL/FixJ family response regulator